MKKIGITGGIGSGKTTVCKIFETLGVPIYYSDTAAKLILENNVEIKKQVVEAFGSSILSEPNQIDKKKLASVVFNDSKKLKMLNAIIHPAVGYDFNNWLTMQKVPYVLKEAAILIESGAYKQLDKVIVVSAPQELRIKRVTERDQVTKAKVEQRLKNQLQESELLEKADYVIINNETISVIEQVLKIHGELLNLT